MLESKQGCRTIAVCGVSMSSLLPVERSSLSHAHLCNSYTGYFFVSGNYGLLIKRRSKHNDRAWDFPGGQADATDANLAQTALREAMEELGALPEHFKLFKSIPLR